MPVVDGTVIRQKFSILSTSPLKSGTIAPVSQQSFDGCCFNMPALAESAFTDETKNDKHSPYFVWNNAFSSADMYLEKFQGGAWIDIAPLNDNTYGTFNAFGFFITKYNESAIGYNLEWSKVLAIRGEGRYRVRCEASPFTSVDIIKKYTFDFCLEEYNDNRADRTTRFSWWLNGTIGDQNDDTHKIDYGILDWFSQLRLPNTMFGNDKSSEHEKTFNKWQNGRKIWTEDSQVESYSLRTGRFPDEIHRFIKINILMADDIKVTDYNSLNPNKHVDREITWTGIYEPDYPKGVVNVKVETDFEQGFQNLNHKRC